LVDIRCIKNDQITDNTFTHTFPGIVVTFSGENQTFASHNIFFCGISPPQYEVSAQVQRFLGIVAPGLKPKEPYIHTKEPYVWSKKIAFKKVSTLFKCNCDGIVETQFRRNWAPGSSFGVAIQEIKRIRFALWHCPCSFHYVCKIDDDFTETRQF